MKKLITIILGLAFLAAGIYYLYLAKPDSFGAMQSHIESIQDAIPETAMEHAKKHADPNYVCPMHPQIIKGEPGSCPICGMDLVKKEPKPSPKKETALDHAKKHADPNYTCPMHPQIVSDEPGSCPICGMDLVENESNQGSQTQSDESEYPTITIKSHTAQNMGVRTAKVKQETLSKDINTVGFIGYNEDKIAHIHTRTKGWIESINVKALGDVVKKGDVLFKYYSPELVAAQEDYLLALKGMSLLSEKGKRNLVESAKIKMQLIGVPEVIINKITETRTSIKQIPIYAPSSGTVINLNASQGMYITPSTVLYSIADLSSVWIIVDVFEEQLNWVNVGSPATIKIEALAGKKWQGKIDYIYPELAPMTRTLRVRIVFDNHQGRFKPNMFADVTLQGKSQKSLTIPNEAIILAEEGSRVVKVNGDQSYEPVKIEIGIQSDGKTEVLKGLKAGDRIVVSSQFLLDSESNLQASFRRMSE